MHIWQKNCYIIPIDTHQGHFGPHILKFEYFYLVSCSEFRFHSSRFAVCPMSAQLETKHWSLLSGSSSAKDLPIDLKFPMFFSYVSSNLFQHCPIYPYVIFSTYYYLSAFQTDCTLSRVKKIANTSTKGVESSEVRKLRKQLNMLKNQLILKQQGPGKKGKK